MVLFKPEHLTEILHAVSVTPPLPLTGIILSVSTAFAFRGQLRETIVQIISYILNIYLLWRYPIRDVTGKKPLPSLPYRWPNGNGDMAKFLEGQENSSKWSNQYGSIYRIWSGMNGEVVVTRPEHLHAVFRDSNRHAKAVNNDSGYFMSQLLGKCVGLLSHEAWRNIRSRMEVPFTHKAVMEATPIIRRHTENYLKVLAARDDVKAGNFDPADDTKFFPFFIIAEFIYGELDDEQTRWLKRIVPIREELFTYVIKGGLERFSFSKYLPTQANKRLSEFQKEWDMFNEETYKSAKRLGTQASIAELWEAVNSGDADRTQMLHTLDETLFANLDVTIGGLSWNFVFLAAYPSEQQRLLDEIRSMRSKGDTAYNGYLQSATSFLAACINESSRLKPLAAFSVPQSAPSDRVIDGWIVPSGTQIIVDSYAINMRNEFWGPDNTVYRPSRFMTLSPSQTRYQMWRFGFGPRQCMGKFVADNMIRSLVASVVERYELSLDDQERDFVVNPKVWITHPQMKIRCAQRV